MILNTVHRTSLFPLRRVQVLLWVTFLGIGELMGQNTHSVPLDGRKSLDAYFQHLSDRALSYAKTDQDSARWYAGQLDLIWPKLDSTQRIRTRTVQGKVAYERGDYMDAIALYEAAVQEAQRYQNFQAWVRSLNRIGNTYTMKGQFEDALHYYEQALNLAERKQLPDDRIIILQSLAWSYQKAGYPEKAIPHYQTVLDHFQGQKHYPGIISTNNLLHIALSNIDSLDQALRILQQNLEPPISTYLSPKDSATMLHNLGRLQNMRQDYPAAVEALAKAIDIKSRQNNPESYAKSLIEWVTSLKAMGDFQQAADIAQRIDTNVLINSSLYTQRDYYRHLSEVYAVLGNYRQAYNQRIRYDSLDQLLFNEANEQSVLALELALAQKEKDQILAEQKAANIRRQLYIRSSIFLLVLVLTALFFRQSQIRQKAKWQAKALAQETRRYKDRLQFFTFISHELRTPLTLILTPAIALQQRLKNPDDRSTAQIIVRNAQIMSRLVEQTLHLERSSFQDDAERPQPVQAVAFVKGLLSGFSPELTRKELQLISSWPDQDPWLLLDTTKFLHIISNLVTNAIKYSPTGGSIHCWLTFSPDDNQLEFGIRDEGPGIPAREQPYIFDRFYQSDTNATQPQGFGIGLHLAKAFAQHMDGDLSVTSKPGHGATFFCRLPLRKSSPPLITDTNIGEEGESLLLGQHSANGATATLLVIEDSTDMRTLITQLLSPKYTILTAANGREGWEILQKNEKGIDLVISDVMMPEMDGFTLLNKIKAEEQLARIPVILLTARSETEYRLKALTAGVNDYISKPFLPQELITRVANLLTFHRKSGKRQSEKEKGNLQHVSVADMNWLKEVEQLMTEKLGEKDLSVTQLAHTLSISERQFYRKVKHIAGMTPNRFWREVKLKEAKRLLDQGAYATVSEVSQAVGFETTEYFSKIFKDRYGISPSNILLKTTDR